MIDLKAKFTVVGKPVHGLDVSVSARSGQSAKVAAKSQGLAELQGFCNRKKSRHPITQ